MTERDWNDRPLGPYDRKTPLLTKVILSGDKDKARTLATTVGKNEILKLRNLMTFQKLAIANHKVTLTDNSTVYVASNNGVEVINVFVPYMSSTTNKYKEHTRLVKECIPFVETINGVVLFAPVSDCPDFSKPTAIYKPMGFDRFPFAISASGEYLAIDDYVYEDDPKAALPSGATFIGYLPPDVRQVLTKSPTEKIEVVWRTPRWEASDGKFDPSFYDDINEQIVTQLTKRKPYYVDASFQHNSIFTPPAPEGGYEAPYYEYNSDTGELVVFARSPAGSKVAIFDSRMHDIYEYNYITEWVLIGYPYEPIFDYPYPGSTPYTWNTNLIYENLVAPIDRAIGWVNQDKTSEAIAFYSTDPNRTVTKTLTQLNLPCELLTYNRGLITSIATAADRTVLFEASSMVRKYPGAAVGCARFGTDVYLVGFSETETRATRYDLNQELLNGVVLTEDPYLYITVGLLEKITEHSIIEEV
jgi:hypothetical protein